MDVVNDEGHTMHDVLPSAGELRASNGREYANILDDALAALDERSRFIITESTMRGVTIVDIGRMIGLPPWKVKELREKAHRRLRRCMEG